MADTNDNPEELSEKQLARRAKKEAKRLAKAKKGKGNQQQNRAMKEVSGLRDFHPRQMRIRNELFATIKDGFARYGAAPMETPVMELTETLTQKYGEESKLIYNLAETEGEDTKQSLRYDLTVPFARFCAANLIKKMKRQQIGRVYRRDKPNPSQGRFREFYQADFDIAGGDTPAERLASDAEVIACACDILESLDVGSFSCRLSTRPLLCGMLSMCGVPDANLVPICSAIDKLDKRTWCEVMAEMVEKGLTEEQAERIHPFVQLPKTDSPEDAMALIMKEVEREAGVQETAAGRMAEKKAAFETMKLAMTDLREVISFVRAMGWAKYIHVDLSLARGLDYYTGVIYEYCLLDPRAGVGSVAAGGRYDHLVQATSGGALDTACVGVSIGVDRLYAGIEAMAAARAKERNQKPVDQESQELAPLDVLVASIPVKATDVEMGQQLYRHRMSVCAVLRGAGLRAEYSLKPRSKLNKQLREADDRAVPFVVLFGDAELAKGTVNIVDMAKREEPQRTVPLTDLVSTLRELGAFKSPSSPAASSSSSPAAAAPGKALSLLDSLLADVGALV